MDRLGRDYLTISSLRADGRLSVDAIAESLIRLTCVPA
jgi:hypothetical protein